MAESSLTWRAEYARFWAQPLPGSIFVTHPALNLVTARKRGESRGGEWTKTYGATAVVRLIATGSSFAVLLISLHGITLEEHFISKLHFSWPQMSCASEAPVRGSRALFASYEDSAGQTQKFALRFGHASESLSFVDTLKESLKYMMSFDTLSINASPQNAAPSGLSTHASNDCEYHGHHTKDQDPVVQFLVEDRMHNSSSQENRLLSDHQMVHPDFPPNSTTAFADCLTQAPQDAAVLQKVTETFNLQSQFPNHMNTSPFLAMLFDLEGIISHMGGDLRI